MRYISIVLLFALFLVVGCTDQKELGYTIKGKFDNSRQADSIYIYMGDSILARTSVIDGVFELKGRVSEPAEVKLYTTVKGEGADEGKGGGSIILENANYSYVYEHDNFKIKGGKLHGLVLGFESSDEYQQAVDDYLKAEEDIYKNTEDEYEPSAEENKLLQKKMLKAIGMENQELAFIIEGKESPLLAKAFALNRIQDWENYSMDRRLELFDSYITESKSEIDKGVIGKLLHTFAEAKRSRELQNEVSAGKLFKDFEAKDVDGTMLKLSDVIAKNNYTILEFWASWCGPCRGEIPNLKKAYEKYKSKGMEIYSISLDEKQDKWLKALKEEGTTWINVVDNKGFKGSAADAYGIDGIPASFLIDQSGKIVAVGQELRGSDLERTLSKFLK